MNPETKPVAPSRPVAASLSSLGGVPLVPAETDFLASARANCGGPAVWRERKLAEGREVFALSRFSERFTVLAMDLQEDFRAMLVMRVPVPVRLPGENTLTMPAEAQLGLTYRAENLRLPSPGFAFVQILAPAHVWHPQVAAHPSGIQALCLGSQLPAGVRVRELLIMTYAALAMSSVQLDAADAAGVMRPEAARWWLLPANRRRIPLSREPFVRAAQQEAKP
jgi:hypothetical protein